jgi:4-hydroxybenzoate polyprenyltransferase
VTVLLPLIGKIELLQWDVLLEFTQRFLFVFALTLPFEIRDLKFDMANLRTVAQIFGVRNSKIIGVLTLLTILLLEFIKVESDIRSVISLILISALLSNLIINSRIRQTKYYSSLWVEGVPILWCLLLLGMHLIYP